MAGAPRCPAVGVDSVRGTRVGGGRGEVGAGRGAEFEIGEVRRRHGRRGSHVERRRGCRRRGCSRIEQWRRCRGGGSRRNGEARRGAGTRSSRGRDERGEIVGGGRRTRRRRARCSGNGLVAATLRTVARLRGLALGARGLHATATTTATTATGLPGLAGARLRIVGIAAEACEQVVEFVRRRAAGTGCTEGRVAVDLGVDRLGLSGERGRAGGAAAGPERIGGIGMRGIRGLVGGLRVLPSRPMPSRPVPSRRRHNCGRPAATDAEEIVEARLRCRALSGCLEPGRPGRRRCRGIRCRTARELEATSLGCLGLAQLTSGEGSLGPQGSLGAWR